jgi:hypothetical protein
MSRRPKLKVLSEAPDPSAATGYVLDDQIGFQLRIAMQRHTSIFMSQMTGDLTQTQFAALAKLLEVGPCSQNHLGRLIYLDASTIKGVVDRLQLRGLRDLRRSQRPQTPRGDADRQGTAHHAIGDRDRGEDHPQHARSADE